jgi:hypothetical protein
MGNLDEHHQVKQGLNRIAMSRFGNHHIEDDELAAAPDESGGASDDSRCRCSIKVV